MSTTTTFHVFIATSLDGFIARPDGGLDWLAAFQGDGDNGYGAFVAGTDAIVMGRGTFEAVLGFGEWPYALPVIVMSRTLTVADLPAALKEKVEILSDTPEELAQRLGARGWRRVYVDGGQLVQAFLRAGLVADMAIFRMPVLLGEGRRLFGPVAQDIRLETVAATILPTGAVRTDYRVLPSPR
jgi:dihydrofolate reductase